MTEEIGRHLKGDFIFVLYFEMYFIEKNVFRISFKFFPGDELQSSQQWSR